MKPAFNHLLPISQSVSADTLFEGFPEGDILACDFAIEGASQFNAHPWGYSCGRLTNIDHHANTPQMQQRISSANLALLLVAARGPAPSTAHIVINHTDCDSVLSSALVAGAIPPLSEFGDAAIAADHTGQANPIADLLQSLDSRRDYALSLRNLHLLLAQKPLESEAQEALDERRRKREQAIELVQSGVFSQQGDVFYTTLPRSIDGEFFPALLPQARIIALFVPHATPNRWTVKLRLGLQAPQGFSLHQLDIPAFDPGYGGRWNAGSNKRGAVGTSLSPDEYATRLYEALVSQT